MDLTDKNVIYIGGFGGIGQKCLYAFLMKNIRNLAIFDLHENTELLDELKRSFGNVTNIFFIKFDITQRDTIVAAYKEAATKMSNHKFDIVINGCGFLNENFIDRTIQTNLLGVIHSTLIAIPYMDKSNNGNGGLIVNISSVAGLEPSASFAVYTASKFGVNGFTRALANPLYYSRTGIAFITICPGPTDTAILDNPKEKSSFSYASILTDRFKLVKRQTAEKCAMNILKVIEQSQNGSIWILDNDEMREIDCPTHWRPTFLHSE